jgi:hypothetical protein
VKIVIVGLSSKRDLCWVPLERLRKAVKSFTRSLPKAGERAEAAELVDGGHHVWYCGEITADSKFAVDCARQSAVHGSTACIPVLNTKALILRSAPEPYALSFEEAVSLIDCSRPTCKLISMFSAHSEDKSVTHELQLISYPEDLEQLGSMAHGGSGVDLEVFADSFTLAEAQELNAMAETFAGHYAELLAAPIPAWAALPPEHHLHLAHVRILALVPALPLSGCRITSSETVRGPDRAPGNGRDRLAGETGCQARIRGGTGPLRQAGRLPEGYARAA